MEKPRPNIVSGMPTQKEIQFLDDRNYEYDAAKAGRDDGKSFSRLVLDSGENIVAGITGWTWASAAK